LTGAADNVLVGKNAGYNTTTGANNVSIGSISLEANTTGSRNTAIGAESMNDNTTADNNTAIGYASLSKNTTGTSNTALGWAALEVNTTASNNVAVGHAAARSNTTGTRIIAIGYGALDAQDTENDNIAIGYNAMTTNNAGAENNIAIGNYALDAALTGDRNVVIGHYAMTSATGALEDTVIGDYAGEGITTGAYNTCIGKNSGNHTATLVNGSQNVLIGSYCHTSAGDSDAANGLGHGISAEAGYTTVGNGANDIRAAHGNVTWATVSDERVKKDITDSTAGLSVINDLRPRTFKYKNKGDIPEAFDAYEEGSTETFKNTFTNHGFIAQEVKEVVDNHPELKDGFKMWDIRENTGQQEVGEAAIIPILVKAIQELSAEIEILKAK